MGSSAPVCRNLLTILALALSHLRIRVPQNIQPSDFPLERSLAAGPTARLR